MRSSTVIMSIATLLALALVAPAFAQEGENEEEEGVNVPLWTIEAHDPDPNVAQEQIVDLIERGMLPVGLEHRPGKPHVVMYGINLGNTVTEVALYTFEDLSLVNQGVGEFLDRGFIPVGLSRHDGGMTFLFVKGAQEVGRWGIVNAALNLSSVESSLSSLSEDGFSPWGLTASDDSMLLLAMEEPGRSSPRETSVQLYNFDPESYTPGISSAMKQGLYPWGIAVRGTELYVQYTRDGQQDGESEE